MLMPFTLAHPAVVLPLVRRPFVPGALVAGAMAPDLPYFLGAAGIASTRAGDWYGVFLNATETHGPLGLLLNLPFALALTAAGGSSGDRSPRSSALPRPPTTAREHAFSGGC